MARYSIAATGRMAITPWLKPIEIALVFAVAVSIHYLIKHEIVENEAVFLEFAVPLLFGLLLLILELQYFKLPEIEERLRGESRLLVAAFAPLSAIPLEGSLNLEAHQVDRTWRQLSWTLREDYCATNYIDVEDIFGKIGQNIVAIQRAKILAGGVKIRKVFFVKDKSELDAPSTQKVIRLHKDAGIIDIRYACISDVLKTRLRKEAEDLSRVGSIDFAVFDNQVVLLWFLDENRKIIGGQVRFGKNECEKYKNFFNELYTEAEQV